MTNRKASIGAASRPIGRLTTGALSRDEWIRLERLLQGGGNTALARRNAGLIAPAGTPDAVLRKLNQALRQALNADDVKERIAADGAVANPSTPEEYALDIDREEAKWARVVRLAKAR